MRKIQNKFFRSLLALMCIWGLAPQKASAQCVAPSFQAYAVSFSNVTATNLTLNWTRGDGDGCIVIASNVNKFTDPVDGVTYGANANYNNQFYQQVVYSGTGSVVNISGLTGGRAYYFRVYEYKCNGVDRKYLRDQEFENPNGVATVASLNYASTNICNANGWQTFNIAGSFNWNCSGTGGFEANAFNSSGAMNDWVISPQFDFAQMNSAQMLLDVYTQYSDASVYPALKIYYSTNYTGTGSPNAPGVIWTRLNYSAPANGCSCWGYNLPVNLSAIGANKAYIGFHYTSSGTSANFAALYRFNNIRINYTPAGILSLPKLNSDTLCASSAVSTTTPLTFSYPRLADFPTGTTFYAQLSSATGAFTNPDTIAIVSSNGTGTQVVNASFKPALTNGTQYRIRMVSSTGVTSPISPPVSINGGAGQVLNANYTFNDSLINLTWQRPLCYDEYMVVASRDSAVSDTVPTDLALLLSPGKFGKGSAYDNGYVVYRGVGNGFTLDSLENGVDYFFAIYTRKGTEWSNAVRLVAQAAPASTPTSYYKTRNSGSWEAVNTWSSSLDGVKYYYANATPDFRSSGIIISSGNDVSMNSNSTIDQVVVEEGATLIRNSATLTINNGPGEDLVIRGTFRHTNGNRHAGSGTVRIAKGGLFEVTYNNLSPYNVDNYANNEDPSFATRVTWEDSSILLWNTQANTTFFLSTGGMTYFPNVDANTVPRLRIRCSNSTTQNTISEIGLVNAWTVNGILEIDPTFQLTVNGTSPKNFRNGVIAKGTLYLNTNTAYITGQNAVLSAPGNILMLNGNLVINKDAVVTMKDSVNMSSSAGFLQVDGTLIMDTAFFFGFSGFSNSPGSILVTAHERGFVGGFERLASAGLSIEADAYFAYNGRTMQTTDSLLPKTVRGLINANLNGLWLNEDKWVTEQAYVQDGKLYTGEHTLYLQPTATLFEEAGRYVSGHVQAEGMLNNNETASFSNIGLEIMPLNGDFGAQLVNRYTDTMLNITESRGISLPTASRLFEFENAVAGLEGMVRTKYDSEDLIQVSAEPSLHIYTKGMNSPALFWNSWSADENIWSTLVSTDTLSQLFLAPSSFDIALSSFTAATANACAPARMVSLVVSNFGKAPLTSATLSVMQNGNPFADTTIAMNLMPGMDTTITYMLPVVGTNSVTEYSVELVAVNGAQDDFTFNNMQSLALISSEAPTATSFAIGNTTFCQGDSTTLGVTSLNASRVQWVKDGAPIVGANTLTLKVKDAGRYVAVAFNNDSCFVATAPIVVTISAFPGKPVITPKGDTLLATTGAASYRWFRGTELLIGENKPYLVMERSGIYSVEAINATGCATRSDAFQATHSAINEATALRNGVQVYPNPTKNSVNIQLPKLSGTTLVAMIDMNGKVLQSQTITASGQVLTLDVSNLTAGVYMLQVTNGGNQTSEKVIIIE